MDALISYLAELRAENSATEERRRIEETRDVKEKADIAATERTLVSWWERHKPGEPLPVAIIGIRLPPTKIELPGPVGSDPTENARRSMIEAFDSLPMRFTTKEFFPLVPEIVAEDVPESQGYDFLRRLVDEKNLWVYQPGAGRRATTYSKEPISVLNRPPMFYGGGAAINGVGVLPDNILRAVEPLPNPAAPPPKPGGIQ